MFHDLSVQIRSTLCCLLWLHRVSAACYVDKPLNLAITCEKTVVALLAATALCLSGAAALSNCKMLVVGLTGGIACGKSTVTAELRKAGIPVIDADLLAKQTTEKGRWGYHRVVKSFGQRCLLSNGELDRTALGLSVFGDPAARRRLNAATHTPVAVALLQQLACFWMRHTPCVVLDMPLLIETRVHKLVGMVVVVSCSPAVQLQRLMLRDGSSAADAQARIDAQLPLATKEQLADVVLHNDSDIQQLQAQVVQLMQRLRRYRRSWRVWLASPSGLLVAAAGLWAAGSWLGSRLQPALRPVLS